MNLEYSEAVGELLQLLKCTEKKLTEKIPNKLIEFWERNSINISNFDIDTNKPLEEINLRPKTKDLIGMIYRNYWCNAEERKEYDKVLIANEEKFQEEARKKYNPEDVFKPIEKQLEEGEIRITDTANMIAYKENLFTKIIQKIKSIFKN